MELVLIFPFSLVTPLDLTPFPRTLVLRAIHIDLWEQPGPADFSAGYKSRSRQRQKRTWLEEKWGFARSVNWEDCFSPSKLQKTATKHNRAATPRSSDGSGRTPPTPDASFLTELSDSVAKDLALSTQLWCPGNCEWWGALAGGWRPDGQVLGGRREPQARPPWSPRSSHLGMGFLSRQLGFPGTKIDVGNGILSLKEKWPQLKKASICFYFVSKTQKTKSKKLHRHGLNFSFSRNVGCSSYVSDFIFGHSLNVRIIIIMVVLIVLVHFMIILTKIKENSP